MTSFTQKSSFLKQSTFCLRTLNQQKMIVFKSSVIKVNYKLKKNNKSHELDM